MVLWEKFGGGQGLRDIEAEIGRYAVDTSPSPKRTVPRTHDPLPSGFKYIQYEEPTREGDIMATCYQPAWIPIPTHFMGMTTDQIYGHYMLSEIAIWVARSEPVPSPVVSVPPDSAGISEPSTTEIHVGSGRHFEIGGGIKTARQQKNPPGRAATFVEVNSACRCGWNHWPENLPDEYWKFGINPTHARFCIGQLVIISRKSLQHKATITFAHYGIQTGSWWYSARCEENPQWDWGGDEKDIIPG